MEINFKDYINPNNFEQALKDHYINSKKEKNNSNKVCFDLRNVQYCDIFEQSLLILWICELWKRNINVSLLLPCIKNDTKFNKMDETKKFINFLKRIRFFNFLSEKKLVDEDNLRRYNEITKNISPYHNFISPLTFFSSTDNIENFINSNIEQIIMRFNEMEISKNFNLIKTGELRRYILKEIGDNVYNYAKGKFGHILMTYKRPIQSINKAKDGKIVNVNKRIKFSNPNEREFFKNLQCSGFLNIIISDKGRGIYNTLRKVYEKEYDVEKSTEVDVINYAFKIYSSSRTLEERLGDLAQIINCKDNTLIPPTGLYWVKEVIRRYNGLLMIRSGKTKLWYDFLSYPDVGHPKKELLKEEALTNFGGTQIKMLFPDFVKVLYKSESINKYIEISKKFKDLTNTKYEYLSIKSVEKVSLIERKNINEYDKKDLAKIIFDMRKEIGKIGDENSKNGCNLIVELIEKDLCFSDNRKFLFLLVSELMKMQKRNLLIVIYNNFDKKNILDDIFEEISEKVTSNVAGIQEFKPIIVLDNKFNFSIYGLKEDWQKIAISLLKKGKINSEKIDNDDLLNRLEHIAIYNQKDRNYELRFSSDRIIQTITKNIEEQFKEIIFDVNKHIYHYHKDKYFLIPSGAYSNGFFDLDPIFKDDILLKKLLEWVRLILNFNEIDNFIFVSLGEKANLLVQNIQKDLKHLVHLNIENPRNPVECLKLGMLSKEKPVVIITDVIGTKRTIVNVLKYVNIEANLKLILAIVDASEEDNDDSFVFNDRTFNLKSLLKHKLNYYIKGRPDCNIEDIILVDPRTNTPIYEKAATDQLLWKYDLDTGDNFFIDEVLNDIGGLKIKHFEIFKKHNTYSYDSEKIISNHGKQIAEVIFQDIKKLIKKEKGEKENNFCIVFPDYTPGITNLVDIVKNIFKNTKIIKITKDNYNNYISYNYKSECNRIIIIDDSISTGETLKRLISIADKLNNRIKSLYIYLLSDRAKSIDEIFIRKVKKFGKSKIYTRCLSNFGIPNFPFIECPICEKINILKKISIENILESKIDNLIKHLIRELKNLMYQETLSPEDTYFMTKIRYLFELAKNNISIRKKIVEIIKDANLKENPIIINLFRMFFFEEIYFFKQKNDFENLKVYYSDLKEVIIDSCKMFMEKPNKLSDKELIYVCIVYSYFDYIKFIEDTKIFLKNKLDGDDYFKKNLLIELFILGKIRFNKSIYKNFINQFHIENIIKDNENIRLIKKINDLLFTLLSHNYFLTKLKRLEDNNKLNNNFSNNFKELKKIIFSRIEPNIEALLDTDILKKEIKEEVKKINIEINDLLTSIESIDSFNKGGIRNEDLVKKCIKLKNIIRYDKKRNLSTLIKDNIMVNICALAKKVFYDIKENFRKIEVQFKCNFEDSEIHVLGNKEQIYTIFYNLYENVFKHGFPDDYFSQNKAVLVEIYYKKIDVLNLVIIKIHDNGQGLPKSEEFSFGEGLNSVNLVGQFILRNINVNKSNKSNYSTFSYFEMYNFTEFYHSLRGC